MKTTSHSMTRRAEVHDYNRPGIYHITLHVAEGLNAPFGAVVGDIKFPDGHPDAPRVALSPVGRMVEKELLTAIHIRYPMVEVHEHVVMPEHLHALLVVKRNIVSAQGKLLPLGQVIAGFKKGCNKRYWEMTGNSGGKTAANTAFSGVSSVFPAGSSSVPPTVPSGFPAGFPVASPAGSYKVPSNATSGRQPLFAPGYCDVMPIDATQLATQRAYIQNNPRSRLLRISHRDRLMPQRGSVATALIVSALSGYIRRECVASTTESLSDITARLLTMPAGFPAGDPFICCDSYGDRALLERRLLPVVCHRKDMARFAEQKARCLEEAASGAVLVSPRIAKGEQEIMDAALRDGFPVVIIHDNGFPDRYHPSATLLDYCAEGRLLLVTPWRYQYRGKREAITAPECKTMNCLAQALSRKNDDWWKESVHAASPVGKKHQQQ